MTDALQSKSRRFAHLAYGLALTIIMTMGLLMVWVTPAMAQDEPDGVNMVSAKVFNSLITDNDTLIVVLVDIQYGDTQDYDVTDAYTFSLLDAEGDTVATNNGLALYNDGYGKQNISFYLDPDVITWGDTHTLRVMQNPAVFPTPQYWDFTIGESEYSADYDQGASLKAYILDCAITLSSVFDVELYEINESGSRVLSTYGELYYLQAIPGLQSMSPELFSVQTESPDTSTRSWSFSFANTLKTKYDGTFIDEFMTGYAGLFSMETSAAMNILSIILFVIIMGLAVWKFRATALSCFLDGYTLLLLLMLLGFFDMMWAGFMAFASVVLGGVILFLNRS